MTNQFRRGFPRRQSEVLICFAVNEEAKFFKPGPFEVLITGMGRMNAAEGIRQALPVVRPELVLTCGFAGGLNPEFALGDIIFDEDFDAGLNETLIDMGASSGSFHCAKRVAVTAEEKQDLWKSTRADAVEMESSVIRTICREFRVPSATIRVILDDAKQDLPLDFNALMSSDDKIDYGKLMWAVFTAPHKIPKLIDFQRQTIIAAKKLASTLDELVRVKLC
jgi:adenosylhomocysteine nucleosidase